MSRRTGGRNWADRRGRRARKVLRMRMAPAFTADPEARARERGVNI